MKDGAKLDGEPAGEEAAGINDRRFGRSGPRAPDPVRVRDEKGRNIADAPSGGARCDQSRCALIRRTTREGKPKVVGELAPEYGTLKKARDHLLAAFAWVAPALRGCAGRSRRLPSRAATGAGPRPSCRPATSKNAVICRTSPRIEGEPGLLAALVASSLAAAECQVVKIAAMAGDGRW